jgi:branched-chain amino acid transport system substrate-binding protein
MKKLTRLLLVLSFLFVSIGYVMAAGTIKIGFFGPLTGPSAMLGQNSLNGATIAVEEINSKGGLLGKKVVLVPYDDKSSPEQAVKAANRLAVVDNVIACLGSLHSGNMLAAGPTLKQFQISTIGNGTSPTWLEQGNQFLFRAIGNNQLNIKEISKYVKKKDFKKIAVLTGNDEYGTTGGNLFVDAAKEAGIKIVTRESFTHGDRDFTGQFARINNSKPDAVLIWALGDDLGAVTKQLRQSGYDGLVIGAEGYGLTQVLDIAGDAANNVIFAAQYLIPDKPEDANDPLMKSFLKRYVKKFGKLPVTDNAFRSYDAMRNIAEGIRRAKSLNKVKIKDGIESLTNYKGIAGDFNYKGNHGEGIHSMRLYRIEDGKYKEVQY